MRNPSGRFVAITFLLFFCSSAISIAQAGKLENIGPLTDASVAETVRQSLETSGYRLTLDDPKSSCELWLRKDLPLASGKETEGVAYPNISESTLLGVIHFADAAADFRGHKIPPGFYTLRYELMPDDGNHLGAAPNRDFALLVPVDSDPDPATSLKTKELIAMSAKVGGTRHPAPLSLVPPDRPGPAALTKDDQDHWIFTTPLKAVGGKALSFAMIVKGTAQQ